MRDWMKGILGNTQKKSCFLSIIQNKDILHSVLTLTLEVLNNFKENQKT